MSRGRLLVLRYKDYTESLLSSLAYFNESYISSGHRLVLMPSTNPKFKLQRGAFHKFVSPNAVREWGVHQQAESTVTIKQLSSLGTVESADIKQKHHVLMAMKR